MRTGIHAIATIVLAGMSGVGSPVFGQSEAVRKPAVIPDADQWTVQSRETGNAYQIQVALPYQYDKADSSFIAIYVLDGNGQFGMTTEISRNLSYWDPSGDEGLIIVGVGYPVGQYYLTQGLRYGDYTPTSDPLSDAGFRGMLRRGGFSNAAIKDSGHGPAFLTFLAEELIPEIEDRYRVDDSRRMIIGHSLGGLIALTALLERPALFSDYLIVSPALWWDCAEDSSICLRGEDAPDGWLLQREKELFAAGYKAEGRMYMTVGADEWPLMIELPGRLDAQLQAHDYPKFEWTFVIEPDEWHMSILGSAITHGLRWLYFGPGLGPGGLDE